MAMNREQKRMMQRQGQVAPDGTPAPAKREPRGSRPPSEPRTSPRQFLHEVRGELRKVAWPTRSEVVNYSIIVLITIIILTSLIAGLDFVFGESVLWVLDR
ncbi:MAG TPA: preprotein translocase subunit SecE [Acidimicrobiales bacterium]|nr:preprotein translocase subunit SecE [Acidimicrobiales bacterium]